MTPFMSLLLPVIVSAVAVFVLSSIIHMAMPWHKGDYAGVADEDGLMAAMRPFGLKPDDYMMPKPTSGADMKSPEFMAKREKGPVVIMTVAPGGPFNMASFMGTWFVFSLVVAAIAGWVTGTILHPGADGHVVFHYTAIITFLCYAMGAVPLSIWYYRKWSTTMKNAFDSLIYAVATGLVFMAMWPKM